MGGPIPGCSSQAGGDSCARVLRNPDHLEGTEPVGRGDRSREVVTVDETTACASPSNAHTGACTAGGGGILVQPRGAKGAGSAAAGAVAVGGGVGAVDVRVLHLDDQEQISGRDRRRATRNRSPDR